MNKNISNSLISLVLVSLVACGGANKELIGMSDVEAAQKSGTLASLYKKTETQKNDASKSEIQSLTQIQSEIIRLVYSEKSQLIDSTLGKKNEYNLNDLTTLDKLSTEIKDLQGWDQNSYNKLLAEINKERVLTQQEISLAKEFSGEYLTDLVKRFEYLKKSAVLSGLDSAEMSEYQLELDKSLQQLSLQGRESYKNRMFNMALSKGQVGLTLDPGNLQFESLVEQSTASLFEQDFRAALENGKPDDAYNALVSISEKPTLQKIKKKMESSIILLANYFANNAKASYQKNEWESAFSAFEKGRNIQSMLGRQSAGFIQEKTFADLLMKKAATLDNQPGVQYGIYTAVLELDPGYPEIKIKRQAIKNKLVERAKSNIFIAPFDEVESTNSVITSVGKRVRRDVEKQLEKKLNQQLGIVTSISDGEINTLPNGPLLKIEGDILQAAIEASNYQGQKSINVQTGISKIETAEYIKWKKRKRGEPPVQFLEQPIMEDVIIKTEHLKKIAVIEATFKLSSVNSTKFLLSDSVTKKSVNKGDVIQEFEKGSYHQPYVESSMPSDIQVIDDLAKEISAEMAVLLVNYLANAEMAYYKKYQQLLTQEQQPLATEVLANAVVLSDDGSSTKSVWLVELRNRALKYAN